MVKVQHTAQNIGDISAVLLAHYDANARALPWRSGPGSPPPDPYHVWLSEIMLQQTTVAAVKPYFSRFLVRWPTVAALATADEAEVMAAWAGLGYYARARNLLKCAHAVVQDHGGAFPDTEAALLSLPGIGRYTAAAIAAIAFGQRAVVVDANVERVVTRLFAIDTPLPAGKGAIRAATDAITPEKGAGDFAQAMMDLGAGLCSVKAPACLTCPLAQYCSAYQAGRAESYPVKPPKKAKPLRKGTAYWIERDKHIWLVQRPGTGMLGGMRALPDDGWSARKDGSGDSPLHTANWTILNQFVQHSFTHFTLELKIAVTAWGGDAMMLPHGEWWPLEKIDKAGLPTLFVKAVKLAQRK